MLPPRLTDSDFKTGIEFARKIKQENPDRYEAARKILLTHLSLHENITEAVQSILSEYSLDYNTRMLFIGVAGIINRHE